MTFWPAVLELSPVLCANEQNALQRQTHTLELLPHRRWNDYGDRKETANDARRLLGGCLHWPLSGLSVNGATRCAGIFVQVRTI